MAQGAAWFCGKNSSNFVLLLLFISVLGIGTSWRQEMPLLEGQASSTGISRDALGLGTQCLSRCHWPHSVFIQSPSSSPQRLGLDAAA